jgi:hypothetical protein
MVWALAIETVEIAHRGELDEYLGILLTYFFQISPVAGMRRIALQMELGRRAPGFPCPSMVGHIFSSSSSRLEMSGKRAPARNAHFSLGSAETSRASGSEIGAR